MAISFRWLTIPWTNQTKEVQVVQTWEVRWESRHGKYSDDVSPEVEVFFTKEQADEFATSLKNAFLLARITYGDTVTLKKTK